MEHNKEKQIEEMAVEFAKINCNPKGCYSCNLCDEYGSLELSCEDYLYYRNEMAETFYTAGYRKASDVAREIFEEIEASAKVKYWRGGGLVVLEVNGEDFAELKKKYIGKDTNVTTNMEERK